MIVTRQSRIPFRWLFMAMVPWVFFYFLITIGGVNFFILNRLIDNPAALTFAVSLPGLLFTVLPLGSYISYTSDRVWTPWGRRKIFLVAGFSGAALMMVLYPLAPTVWVFIGLMIVAQFFGCFNAPFEAMQLEIIPPAMRGRSTGISTWITTVVNILFWMMVVGRFDEVIPFLGIPLSGDKIIYWSAAAGLLIALFIYFFGIHELPPHSRITGEKFRLKTMWEALTAPQLRYLYVFGVASILLGANLGALGQLLYINQWGYSLQEMGFNIAVGGIINLFIIPAVGFLADKGKGHNRMKIWIACLVLILLLNVSYFSYVTWYLPDQRPSLVEMIFFGEVTCVVGIVAQVVYYPLVYDYVPRNLMGTYFAGFGILSGVFQFLTVNGLGVFMLCWANLFQPPAGEMVRVCLAKEMTGADVSRILSAATLSTPDGGAADPKDVIVRPWYANGVSKDSGLCQEIRLRDPAGDGIRVREETLKKTINAQEAKKDPGDESRLAEMRAEQAGLAEEISRRVGIWSGEVRRALGDVLIKPGGETLAAAKARAGTALLPTLRKARDREVDKMNGILRADDPGFLGMRIVSRGHGFFLSVSRMLPDGADMDADMDATCRRIEDIARTKAHGLVAPSAVRTGVVVKPVLAVETALVEDPVPTFSSPISRAMEAVLSPFAEVPPPDQKLVSLARSLGAGDGADNARVEALPARNGLRVTCAFDEEALRKVGDPAALLVERIRAEGASLKFTVPAELVDKGIVPIKYNYLAGYLYIFFMVFCGFLLVGFFLMKEKAGVVRRLGAEEAEAEESLEGQKELQPEALAPGAVPAEAGKAETYTPGFLLPKLAFAALGFAAMLVAIYQAWPQLRLLAHGESAEAVAVAVVAKKTGQQDLRLGTQAELDAKTKEIQNARDYQWTFFNEYRFEPREGMPVIFCREVGCKLKPPMPLLDESGLPATAWLLYDPGEPARAVLPMEYSSWFVPALVASLGLIAFLVGSALAWAARKPIPITVD